MKKCRFLLSTAILIVVLMSGCGGPRPPLDEIREALKGVPTYSVILDDMKVEGTFSKAYSHRYRILMEEETAQTGWLKVSEKYFRRFEPFLGMTIWVKKEGKESESIGPAGYEYVGNPRYGQWRTDSSGMSFWVFYGQYRLLSDLLGRGPIYRNDYNTYTRHRSQGRPYYGPQNQYGTNGSFTKRQKPNFYARRMSKEQGRKSSFSDRVNKRVGRSRVGVRGRGMRVGK
jgi:hypothetical protein